jgi:DNA-binding GntR family transcriptional regulator
MPVPSAQTTTRVFGRREAVTRQLRYAIVTGALNPGEVVKEPELAAWLGVSVTPVREALSRLAGEGLVEIRANKPKRVAPLDRAGARQLVDVYQVLVVTAVSWAGSRITAEDLEYLREAKDAFVAALGRGDPDAGVVHLDRYYERLFGAAGNAELDAIMRTVRAKMLRVIRLYSPASLYPEFAENHSRNFANLEKGDTDAVIAAMSARLDAVRALLAGSTDDPWTTPGDGRVAGPGAGTGTDRG